MTLKPAVLAVPAALLSMALAAALPAAANVVTISGSGIWNTNAPTTEYSVAGETYSFSFQITSPIVIAYQDANISLTTTFSNYQYKLNGVVVPGTPDDVAFFDAALYGGLVLAYSDHSIEFIGPDIGSTGTIALGNYSADYPNMDYVTSGGVPVNEGAGPAVINVVPEPAAWTLALAGFGAVGGALRSRRRTATSAA